MSFYREFVRWEDEDGKWYMGLYDSYCPSPSYSEDEEDDFDPEWDTVWYTNLCQVWGPASSKDDVFQRFWPYANPGHGGEVLRWSNTEDRQYITTLKENLTVAQ